MPVSARTKPVTLVVAATIGAALLLVGGVLLLRSRAEPPPVSAGAAVCPATRDVGWKPAAPTRDGDLVPPQPTRALLCVYPFPRTGTVAQLSDTHRLDDAPDRVADYLNGLPASTDAETVCLAIGTTQYTVVLEYPGGHATVPIGCGLEYAGAVRPEVNLKRLLAFWNVPLG